MSAEAEDPAPAPSEESPWRLAFVALTWLAAFRLVADHGVRLLPLSLARRLTMQDYLIGVVIVVTLLGLATSALLLRAPRKALGLDRFRGRALVLSVLLAPPAYVAASYFAIWIALPTLLEEIARGGRQLAQQSTGEFGRSLTASSAVSVIAWGVIASPIGEELLFRGALWAAVQRVVDRFRPAPAAPESDALPSGIVTPSPLLKVARAVGAWFGSGGVATLCSAAVFAAMHADMPGGLGIVRWVSALGLGLATGMARHASGGLFAPIALHVGYNLCSIATTRRWLLTESFPSKLGVPTLLSAIAALMLLLAVAAFFATRRRRTALD